MFFSRTICKYVSFAILYVLLPRIYATTPPVINECPGQNVNTLRQNAEHFELSFLFYYVSWSSAARQALIAYDGIANYYYDEAYFGAIDCWHLQCYCSRTLGVTHGSGAPNRWPTMIVRFGHQITMQYQGEWQFEDMSRFVNNLLNPLERVQSSNDIKELGRDCDAIVLALCRNARSLEYKRFVAAAIKWLETDPERNFRFAVAFGHDAQRMIKKDNATLPLLVLIDTHNNKLHAYNFTGTWNYNHIIRWVQNSLKSMYHYVNGYNSPRSVALKTRNGPVLTLSVNAQPYAKHFHTIMSDQLGITDQIYRQYRKCEQFWEDEFAYDDQAMSTLQLELDVPEELLECLEPLPGQCKQKFVLNKKILMNYYRVNSYLDYLRTFFVHHTIDEESGAHGTSNLLALHQRNICISHPEIATAGLKINIAKFINKASQRLWRNIPETQRRNNTLSVVLLNSVKHKDYLMQLDIPVDTNSAANAFIVDAEREAIYFMETKSFSYSALLDFMRNYYADNLPVLHKSSKLPMPSYENTEYISTYNRQLLLQVLQQPNNVTNVVLLYTPGCELSVIMAQSFIQLSLLLHSNDIRFIRLDTQANTLPWELVIEETPTLLVFPADRFSESRIFPRHLKADVRNLFAFVLAQVQPETQLRLALTSCKRTRHLRSCLEFAKSLVMQHIGQYLKFWEIYETERQLILEHLKEFNDFHIKIESNFRI